VSINTGDVEDHRVGMRGRKPLESLAAVGRELDLVALERQRALQRSTHGGLVVDHEDAHSP
jgi:hypothetical protein